MSTPKFLTFDEAVATAKLEHDVDFVALRFNEATQVLAAYTVSVDSDEPDYVNVAYSGGALFDFAGEEDFYDDEEAPQEAKELFYVHQKELGDGDPAIFGMTSEYVLFAVLPGLQEPEKYPSEAVFATEAARIFKEFWKV